VLYSFSFSDFIAFAVEAVSPSPSKKITLRFSPSRTRTASAKKFTPSRTRTHAAPTPSKRPVTPSKRPVTPSKRPVTPSKKPVTPSKRPPTPSLKKATPTPFVIKEIVAPFAYNGGFLNLPQFSPKVAAIKAGTPVTWKFVAPKAHNAAQLKTIGDGLVNNDASNILYPCYGTAKNSYVPRVPGATTGGFCVNTSSTFERTVVFTVPGTYYFGCEPHLVWPLKAAAGTGKALMQGSIIVSA